MSNLQDRLDEFKETFESGAPPYNASHEAIEMMHRTTEQRSPNLRHEAKKEQGERNANDAARLFQCLP